MCEHRSYLDLPSSISDAKEVESVCNLIRGQRINQVLLVRQDQKAAHLPFCPPRGEKGVPATCTTTITGTHTHTHIYIYIYAVYDTSRWAVRWRSYIRTHCTSHMKGVQMRKS